MKPVKNLVFAALLVASIGFNSFAGDIQQPGIAAPQPTPSPERMANITDETVADTTDSQQITVATDYLFLDALAALLSVY